MGAIYCYIGDLRGVGNSPAIDRFILHPPSIGAPQTIGDVFRQASGAAALDIELNWSRRETVAQIPNAAPLALGLLHDGLGKLLDGPVKQPAVGLLLADYFQDDLAQYGAMFDLDTHDGIVSPRQGCAIFVSAIQDALDNAQRGTDPQALQEFIAYTAVHELGHAFNLWHADQSFMEAHPHPEAPGPYGFVEKQQVYLALAANPEDATFVLPGRGCSNYGQRPDGWTGLDDSSPFEGPSTDSKSKSPLLVFEIRLSHESFYSFEPIELDVCLSLPHGVEKPVNIPNEIDPGYENFQIWITEPSGERRRYRSLTRFCRSNGSCTVSPSKPYRRDISVFRQSGGSTFRAAGRHHIQVAYRISAERTLWSNIVECHVKSADPTSDAWLAGREALESRETRNLLRFKSIAPTAYGYTGLVDFASKHASPETAAAIHYAIGKSFLNLVNRSPRSHATQQWHRRSQTHLETAAASRALCPHRRGIIETLLGGESQPIALGSKRRRSRKASQ